MTTGGTTIHSVILAEDDQDDSYIFQDALNELKAEIKLQMVSDGKELMSLLSQYVPDLLFLDLDMPYKNGLECLVELRNNPALRDLPVVAFSSTTRPANIQTAYDMGAHLFLIKSAVYLEYKAALKAILELDWSRPQAIKEQYCVNNRYTVFS